MKQSLVVLALGLVLFPTSSAEGRDIIRKGDVVVVPAGVPHWFKEVAKPINYYMVKVVKP